MQYKVNANCIGCGLCAGTCPAVFSMEATGLAKAAEEDVDQAQQATAEQAKNDCPVGAIESE